MSSCKRGAVLSSSAGKSFVKQAVTPRSLTALLSLVLILGVIVYVTASLGFWQLDRGRQKQALAQSYEQGQSLAPFSLNVSSAAYPQPWQAVQVDGRWLPSMSLLLDNRALNGRPGYWVAGVLQLPASSAHVLVLRGWVERRFDGLPEWQTPAGTVQLTGRALTHVPKLYELQRDPVLTFSDVSPVVVQNIEIHQLEVASGLHFLPFVVQQVSPAPDGLQRSWEPPRFDINKHRGYALQWFLFAGFALFVLGVAVVRYLRSSRAPR